MGKLKVGEGQKFDATQVSAEGLSAQEIAEIIKKNNKFINIYNAYNTDGKEGLTQIELAAAMDDFLKTSGDDNKISRRDFNKMAEEFNRTHGLSGDKKVSGGDLKGFFKSVIEVTRNDEKVSTQQVLDEQNRRYEQMLKEMQEDMQARERQQEIDQNAFNSAKEKFDEVKETIDIDEIPKETQQEQQDEQEVARLKELQTPKDYTVQLNDSFRGLIKKSLKSQDIEITEENMNKAIKEFKKNNPNAVHSQNGVEYLYAGAVVKIAGNLTNKNNADDVIKSYQEAIGGNSSRHETPNEKKTPAEQEPVVKENPPAVTNPEPRVYHVADADPTTGKFNNADFVLFNDSVMTKYDPGKKGYVAYTGLRDGKYYENGKTIQLAQKKLVDYDKEKFGKNYNTPEYRKYYTYSYYNNNSTATLTPAQEDPTYDSNVQIKIGSKTFELERKLTVNLAGSSYDYNDFIEDFVDTETGTISAKEISNDSYFLTSGKERYNVTIDKETGALMVEINGKKVDLNDLMTGKATI